MCGDRDLKKIIDQSSSSEWLVKELKLSYIIFLKLIFFLGGGEGGVSPWGFILLKKGLYPRIPASFRRFKWIYG